MLGVPTSNVEDVAQFDRVVYQPVNNTLEVFEKFCQIVWEKRQNVLVIVDEVDEHATVYNLPPNFGKLVRLGRHKGIGVFGVTRRIANVNKTLPALSNHIISFRQTLPNDVAYLADFIGWDNASKLKDLPDFVYLHFDWKVATISKTRKDKEQPVQEQDNEKPTKENLPDEKKAQNASDTTSFKYPKLPNGDHRKKPQTGLF
jgi:hypothetical protein